MSDVMTKSDSGPTGTKGGGGSVLFLRLKPTYRITEIITLAFYPMFFGFVGGATSFGYGGPILFSILGFGMAVVAIILRRWGARWANSWMEKREHKCRTGDYAEGEEVAPHNTFILMSDMFYMSMEIYVISSIASFILLMSYGNSYSTFASFYRESLVYIDFLHNYYSGLDAEMHAHVGSRYENRIYLIKSISLVMALTSIYAILIIPLRLALGWHKYWKYLFEVSKYINFSKQSRILLSLILFPVIIIISINSIFYDGLSYYLIAGDIPENLSYLFASIAKIVLTVGGLWFSVSFQILFLISYIVSVAFCLISRPQQERS